MQPIRSRFRSRRVMLMAHLEMLRGTSSDGEMDPSSPRVLSSPFVERARGNTWIVFILFAVLAALFGIFPGPWFEDTDLDRDSKWLVTSYATVAVVLTVAIALTAYRRGEMWAWLAFWVWPAFFILHGTVFFVVDFVFALIGIVALVVARRRGDTPSPA